MGKIAMAVQGNKDMPSQAEELGGFRILFVEPDPTTTDRIVRKLQESSFAFAWRRVNRKEDLLANLTAFLPDVVLYADPIPAFHSESPAKVVRAVCPDLPVFPLGDQVPALISCLHRIQQQAQARQKEILSSLPVAIYTAMLPPEPRFTWMSETVERLLGHAAEKFVQDPRFFASRIHPEDRDRALAEWRSSVDKGQVVLEYRWKATDTSVLWIRQHATVVRDGQGRPKEIIGTLMDITRQKEVEASLRDSEERYELAINGTNDGLWDWNLDTEEVYYSARWKAMLSYKDEQIGKTPNEWFQRVHPEDIQRVKSAIGLHLQGVVPQFQTEFRMLDGEGTYRWMLARGLAVRDTSGQAHRMAGSQTDISERKKAEEQLLHNANFDPLTDLPNRYMFMARTEWAMGVARQRKDYQFAVLYVNLDRFRNINETLGHRVGDELLKGVAQRLAFCLRPGDTVARIGSDEFTILLSDIKAVSDATRVADRILKELSSPFILNDRETFATASIGIAMYSAAHRGPEDVVRDAGAALIRAKSLGKSHIEIFQSEMHTDAGALLKLEADLRRAIERKEFRVHFQPLCSIEAGRVTGCEALVRWQHAERGLVSPGEFIPFAEESGLIVPIGEWVLRAACAQMKAWHDQGLHVPAVAVNLSARQFRLKNLIALIARILYETKLDPRYLKLEITESVVMEHAEETIATLLDLKKLGVQLSIDDFGTGYSSLAYLKRFPFDSLKIDRSFVKDISTDAEDAAIVKAVISLAHSLKLKTIAEGVETEDQLAFLKTHRCDELQGYLFSKPVPAEAFAAFVADRLDQTTQARREENKTR